MLLPAQAWGEKYGTVTNSERRISRQRAFLPLPGEAKPDWWIVGEVARRLGFGAAFDFKSAADVFREHAALSAFENNGSRDFDIGALKSLSDEAFDELAPVQWPMPRGRSSRRRASSPTAAFLPPDRKARFIAPETPALRDRDRAARPLRLNTGRIRDQWHTMTRTRHQPAAGPASAGAVRRGASGRCRTLRLADGDFARVVTDYGQCTLKVASASGSSAASLFVPIHWSGETAPRRASASSWRRSPIRIPASPRTRQRRRRSCRTNSSFAASPCRARRSNCPAQSGGRASRLPAATAICSPTMPIWRDGNLAALASPASDLAEYKDFGGGVYRAASFAGGRIAACLFIGPAGDAGDWDVVKSLFALDALSEDQRRMLLSGKSTDGLESRARSSVPASASVAARFAMPSRREQARLPRSGCS